MYINTNGYAVCNGDAGKMRDGMKGDTGVKYMCKTCNHGNYDSLQGAGILSEQSSGVGEQCLGKLRSTPELGYRRSRRCCLWHPVGRTRSRYDWLSRVAGFPARSSRKVRGRLFRKTLVLDQKVWSSRARPRLLFVLNQSDSCFNGGWTKNMAASVLIDSLYVTRTDNLRSVPRASKSSFSTIHALSLRPSLRLLRQVMNKAWGGGGAKRRGWNRLRHTS